MDEIELEKLKIMLAVMNRKRESKIVALERLEKELKKKGDRALAVERCEVYEKQIELEFFEKSIAKIESQIKEAKECQPGE